MKKDQRNALIGLFVLVVTFVAISYLLQSNSQFIEDLINKTKIRDFAIVFVLIVIIGTVFVPITFIPLIPLAVFSYGWIETAVLITVGEFIGSMIAFGISRKYGLPLVSRLVSLEDIEKYEKRLPEGNLFWAIVFIRIALPIDLLSYVLGLFSRIRIETFAFATLIGAIPGAFTLAYLGTLELKYQLIAFVMFIAVILIGFGIDARYKVYKKKQAEKLLAG